MDGRASRVHVLPLVSFSDGTPFELASTCALEFRGNIDSKSLFVARKRLDFSSVTTRDIHGTDTRQNSKRKTNVIYCLYKTV